MILLEPNLCKNIRKSFNDLERMQYQLQFEKSLPQGAWSCNASLDQREKPNNKPFSKGIHAILQLEQIRDLQKEFEIGN